MNKYLKNVYFWKRPKLQFKLGLLFLATALVAIGLSFSSNSIAVSVRNSRASAIARVSVQVTGRSYALGAIQPNAVATVYVSPLSESDVKISYDDIFGKTHRFTVDCYLEPKVPSQINVVIGDDGIAFDLPE